MRNLLIILIVIFFNFAAKGSVTSYQQDGCLEPLYSSFESGVDLTFCDDTDNPFILTFADGKKSVLVVKENSREIGEWLCNKLGHLEFVEMSVGSRVTCNDEDSRCSEVDKDGYFIPTVIAEAKYKKTIDPLGYYKNDEESLSKKMLANIQKLMVINGRYRGGRFLIEKLICKDSPKE